MKSKIIDLDKDRFNDILKMWKANFLGEKHKCLCNSLIHLFLSDKITDLEYDLITKYRKENAPEDRSGGNYWYVRFEYKKRTLWLNQQIKRNEE